MSDNRRLRVVPEARRNVGLPTAGRRADQALECESLERCHSERSEESLLGRLFIGIPRSADSIRDDGDK